MAELVEPYEFEASTGPDTELWEAMDKRMREVESLREEAPDNPEEEIVGAILSFNVADGKALYRVVNDDPVQLQHLSLGDNYTIPDAQIRGMQKEHVISKIKQQNKLAEIFNHD